MNWKPLQQVQREARVLYFVFKHPRTRWYVKCIAACPVAYLFSPVQLIPSFIPVIGFLDDFLVLLVGAKLVERLTAPDLLRQCRELADAAQLEGQRDAGFKSGWAPVLVKASLLLAFAASALLAAYIYL
jgi:uncharacterized membrane protein YkvA (DUF1232 family)